MEICFPFFPQIMHFMFFGSKEYQIKTKIMPILLIIPPLAVVGTMPISETATRKLRFFSLDPYTGKI
jgi:hypothetical protein